MVAPLVQNVMHELVKPLYCTPETNVAFFLKYTSTGKKKKGVLCLPITPLDIKYMCTKDL